MSSPLADDLFRDQVMRARNTPPGEKLSAGFRLFVQAEETMRAGIRMENPTWNDAAVECEVGRRLDLQRHLEKSLNPPGYRP